MSAAGTALEAAWSAMLDTPVFGVALTLGAYQVGRSVQRRAGGSPLANPVLIAVTLIGVVLTATGIDEATYARGGDVVALLLGPATVALALPLHRELPLVRRAAVPIVGAIVVGSGLAVVVAVLVVRGLGGSELLAVSMAPTSATTPVSIVLSADAGGVPALTAVLTIVAGIVGAVAGPGLLTRLGVHDERVRGVAVGVSSHGIGTARLMVAHRTAGAFSGLAMALTALATSVWVPVLVPLLT